MTIATTGDMAHLLSIIGLACHAIYILHLPFLRDRQSSHIIEKNSPNILIIPYHAGIVKDKLNIGAVIQCGSKRDLVGIFKWDTEW